MIDALVCTVRYGRIKNYPLFWKSVVLCGTKSVYEGQQSLVLALLHNLKTCHIRGDL